MLLDYRSIVAHLVVDDLPWDDAVNLAPHRNPCTASSYSASHFIVPVMHDLTSLAPAVKYLTCFIYVASDIRNHGTVPEELQVSQLRAEVSYIMLPTFTTVRDSDGGVRLGTVAAE